MLRTVSTAQVFSDTFGLIAKHSRVFLAYCTIYFVVFLPSTLFLSGLFEIPTPLENVYSLISTIIQLIVGISLCYFFILSQRGETPSFYPEKIVSRTFLAALRYLLWMIICIFVGTLFACVGGLGIFILASLGFEEIHQPWIWLTVCSIAYALPASRTIWMLYATTVGEDSTLLTSLRISKSHTWAISLVLFVIFSLVFIPMAYGIDWADIMRNPSVADAQYVSHLPLWTLLTLAFLQAVCGAFLSIAGCVWYVRLKDRQEQFEFTQRPESPDSPMASSKW